MSEKTQNLNFRLLPHALSHALLESDHGTMDQHGGPLLGGPLDHAKFTVRYNNKEQQSDSTKQQ
jgi:hypothetical protein